MRDPIVIVGRGCVLPSAFDVAQFGHVLESRSVVLSDGSDADFDLAQGAFSREFLGVPTDGAGRERTWTARAGFVRGFDAAFDPKGLELPAPRLLAGDAIVRWAVHAGRQALEEAGMSPSAATRARAHAILGNLSYPTPGHARAGEQAWWELQPAAIAALLGQDAARPAVEWTDRFSSGLPVARMARALGCSDYLALDAACASSLYAIKVAVDRLNAGETDLVLAGGVNRADPLFLQLGFAALGALSRSGRSLPLHPGADGLLPAQGAVVLALRRLSDALRDGQPVLGVIAGIGVSNDGADGGFLAPAAAGQIAAYEHAYAQSSVDPGDLDYLECHATGTALGDRIEIDGVRAFFGPRIDFPVGSLKANLGHLITAAGAAGVLKVLAGFQAERLWPMPYSDAKSAFDPEVRFVAADAPWSDSEPRFAGVNAFGFGGNNAHLVLQAYRASDWRSAPQPTETRRAPPVIVENLALRVGDHGTVAVRDALRRATPLSDRRSREIRLAVEGTRTTPRDLSQATGQQLVTLCVCREVVAGRAVDPARTGLFVAMACDSEITRHGARWRLRSRLGSSVGPAWFDANADAWTPPLTAERVTGTMPNIVANRVSLALDVRGPAFTVSAEEGGGAVAIALAQRALANGEIDHAIVAAVDLADEPVHHRARKELGWNDDAASDVGVALLLTRGSSDDTHEAIRVDASSNGDPTDEPHFDASVGRAGVGGCGAATALFELALAIVDAEGQPSASARAVRVRDSDGWTRTIRVIRSAAATIADAPEAHDGALAMRFAARLPTVDLAEPPGAPTRKTLSTPTIALPRAPELPSVDAPVPTFAPGLARQAAPPSDPVAMPPAPSGHELGTLAAYSAQRALIERLAWGQQRFGELAGVGALPALELDPTRTALIAAADAHDAFLHTLTTETHHALKRAGLPASAAAPSPSPSAPMLAAHAAQHDLVQALNWARSVPCAATDRAVATPPAIAEHPTPQFSRSELELLASRAISRVFGPQFVDQDAFEVQVRMPMPPLLLADRVTELNAEPRSMGTGSIFTETDIANHRWTLHHGRMAPGLMMEAGQADLLLVSYLGIDFFNRGERRYRLLGCEATYRGPLPEDGDTLAFDIRADGHANVGDVRLFFFSSDCRVGDQIRLSVRHGQAGFFSERELAASEGVLWSPESDPPDPGEPWRAPELRTSRTRLSADALQAVRDGDVFGCFGAGFELAASHTRTPTIPGGPMALFDVVDAFEPMGGPWGRGYLRATAAVSADAWFFAPHFKNDPCMPGTLMLDAGVQGMALFMIGRGLTLRCDGWRFEPVPDHTIKLQARGQVLPTSQSVVYEVFVRSLETEPIPVLTADILGTVDGLKAFHCRALKLQLVPDWPVSHADRSENARRSAASTDSVPHDERAMFDCALGRPSHAFGAIYRVKDGPVRVPRLPGPPYLCISRITRMPAVPAGSLAERAAVTAEFDVDPSAWYFEKSGTRGMPFAILLEAALQPCGWLASYLGCAAERAGDVCFRNLDGTGSVLADVLPDAGSITTDVELTKLFRSADTTIVGFRVHCAQQGRAVYRLETVFGFFTPDALRSQVGIPTDDRSPDRALFAAPQNADIDLRVRSSDPLDGCRLPSDALLMPDRITGLWPDGGAHGRGAIRVEKRVHPGDWYFKAHFFQDPVQPGSLGIEAMLQALRAYLIETGVAARFAGGCFRAIATGIQTTWKYRGQVLPTDRTVVITLSIASADENAEGYTVTAEGSLWVDGVRIYEASGLGMTILRAPLGDSAHVRSSTPHEAEETFDPRAQPWVRDHCPTYVIPVLPMMVMIDKLAGAVRARTGLEVVSVDGFGADRWLECTGARRLRYDLATVAGAVRAELLAFRQAPDARLSRFERIAGGEFRTGRGFPAPSEIWPWQPDGEPITDPYGEGGLFHGPALQYLSALEQSNCEGWGTLVVEKGAAPLGALGGGLLDGLLHAIPHDAPHRWVHELPHDRTLIPYRLNGLSLYRTAPQAGEVRVHARCLGLVAGPSPDRPLVRSRVRAWVGEQPWIEFVIDEVALPKGRLGVFSGTERRRFACDREFVEGMRVSVPDGDASVLVPADLDQMEWLAGTTAAVYGTRSDGDGATAIAVQEHVAARWRVHPSAVDWRPERGVAECAQRPFAQAAISVRSDRDRVEVCDAQGPHAFADYIAAYWKARKPVPDWPGSAVFDCLVRQFVAFVHLDDPTALASVCGRPCLFLANHEVEHESMLLPGLLPPLQGTRIRALAAHTVERDWLSTFPALLDSYPGASRSDTMVFVDQRRHHEVSARIEELARSMVRTGASGLVHVEGWYIPQAGARVRHLSNLFIELALRAQFPIVPVRIDGGLPADLLSGQKLRFPVDFGKQAYFVGRPILPEDLAGATLVEQRRRVLDAINGAGAPGFRIDEPIASMPDVDFGRDVAAWRVEHGASLVPATVAVALRRHLRDDPRLRAVVEGRTPAVEGEAERRWWSEFTRWLRPSSATHVRPVAVPAAARARSAEHMVWQPNADGIAELRTALLGGDRAPCGPGEAVLRSLIEAFAGEVRAVLPLSESVLSNAVFVSNHQIELEFAVFPLVLSALLSRPVITLPGLRLDALRIAELVRHCARASDLRGTALGALVHQIERQPVSRRLSFLREQARAGRIALHVHAAPCPQSSDDGTLTHIPRVWRKLLGDLGRPIVPVRFRGGFGRVPQPYSSAHLPEAWLTQTCLLGEPLPAPASVDDGDWSARVCAHINALDGTVSGESRISPQALERATRWRDDNRGLWTMAVIAGLLLESPATPSSLRRALDGGLLVGNADEQAWLSDLLVFLRNILPPERPRRA